MHAGAVIVPAVLAACERHNPDGPRGAARHRGRRRGDVPAEPGGAEGACTRRAFIRPRCSAPWRAAAGVGAALELDAAPDRRRARHRRLDGRRHHRVSRRRHLDQALHAGWAAQSGLRAALLARAGFLGPRTVFEGVHGLFHGFAHTTTGDYDALIGDFGARWVTRDARLQALSVRNHDASLHRLRAAARGARDQGRGDRGDGLRGRRRHGASAVGAARRQAAPAQRLCRQVLHALLHRRRPSCAAMSGSMPSPTTRCRMPRVLALAAKVRYRIDPHNPYPNEFHRPHPRGARRRPRGRGAPAAPARRRARAADARATSRRSSCSMRRHGGWDDARTERALALLRTLYDGRIDLSSLRG